MSVIGPRPGLWNQDILTAERDKYNANDVKPGLTGWAQINGRDELEIPEKAKLDVFRQGDLTLGDFWSVGKTQEVEFEKKHISCILVNTEKGEKILKNLVKNNKIIIFERPIEEETRYERQLNSPTNKNEIREKFLKYYKLNKNFDKAMRKATFKIRYSNLIKTIIHYERIKTVLRVWIPQKYRTKFKQVKKNSKI